MSKDKTKKVTITLTEHQQNIARECSFALLGKENISGFIGYLISKEEKNGKR